MCDANTLAGRIIYLDLTKSRIVCTLSMRTSGPPYGRQNLTKVFAKPIPSLTSKIRLRTKLLVLLHSFKASDSFHCML